jgi:hypothetical protein
MKKILALVFMVLLPACAGAVRSAGDMLRLSDADPDIIELRQQDAGGEKNAFLYRLEKAREAAAGIALLLVKSEG